MKRCEIIFCIKNKRKAIVLTLRVTTYGFSVQNPVQLLLKYIQIAVLPERNMNHIGSSKVFFVYSGNIRVVLMNICHQNLATVGGKAFFFSFFLSCTCLL